MAGTLIVVAGILCTGLLINYSDKPVFIYLMNAHGLFTPGIATMFLMGIFWKRTTQAGALATGIFTIPLSLLIEFTFPEMPFLTEPALYSGYVCCCAWW